MNWFTSDLHFGHKNVIPYCNRPFVSVEDMERKLIGNWNAVVDDSDIVYVLGDFAFCGAVKCAEILAQLKGTKLLIRGNHDRSFTDTKWKRLGFNDVLGYNFMMKLGNHTVVMSHFPYKGNEHDERKFEKYQISDEGYWLLHGHVHKTWGVNGRMINVGVDEWAYDPVSEREILHIIAKP